MTVKIAISEDPNTVAVEYRGHHAGTWTDDGEVQCEAGDANILRAALMAWDGDLEFTLEYDELVKRAGGEL